MLNQAYIRDLAIKKQTTQLNISREYVQHLFLSYFYLQPKSDFVLFKGGTALRILYGSPRFSIDLDFSSSIGKKAIEQIIISVLTDIEREGIRSLLKEAKTTTGGYLAIFESEVHGNKIVIQLEISLRTKKMEGEVVTVVNDFVPTYTVVRLREKDLVNEKIQALLERKKPRDFYDVYFLLRAGLIPRKTRRRLPVVLSVLKQTRINFARELKELLPKTHWSVIKNLRKNLEQEIERFI